MRNGVQLITYADRMGDTGLQGILDLLDGPLHGGFTGVHLLPFFDSIDGADAGFDPIDHTRVDPRIGTWDDVARLAGEYDVTADLIVNHISDQSPEFTDYRMHGAASRYAGMFLTFAKVFPDGATEGELLQIYRPRPGLPFTTFTLRDGTRHLMWTTFTGHQVDLDVFDPAGRAYLLRVLDGLAASGVRQVRLDAVGYAVKTPGTTSFMTDDTYRFISDLLAAVHDRGMEVLVEIHAHHSVQEAIATRVDRVYNFALAPLTLHALFTGTGTALGRWLATGPRNTVTVLDTHDGIGIIDVAAVGEQTGLLEAGDINLLVERIHEESNGESRLATGAAASNLDLYQVNCTFFSALGEDDQRYLLARLVQFFAPGIPQVYYAGLLAARNDVTLLKTTGIGRDINRPYYTGQEVRQELRRPVVRHLIRLIRFRNSHPAFNGEFDVGTGPAREIRMRWSTGSDFAETVIDLERAIFTLTWTTPQGTRSASTWDEL